MNARLAKKMIVLSGLLLSACASGSIGDAEAPLEPRIAALVDENRAYPRWADFPGAPTDVPTAMQLAMRVNTLRVASGSLAGEAARIDWTLSDTEAFAREVAARVQSTPIARETRATQADIEAFAQSLRDRGRAPPPVPRR